MRLACGPLAALLLCPTIALAQGEGDAAEASEPLPLPEAPTSSSDDTRAPLIEDVAVAAANPATPPMITAVITDDWSGVEEASVYYRPIGDDEFQKVPLHAGRGGLFVARLPDGVQRRGFAYYVEVYDAAKNGPALMGTAEQPFIIPAASEGTPARLERERSRAELGPVHPAFMMLSLGTGLLAGAGAGVFWLDYAKVSGQLKTEPAGPRRQELEEANVGNVAIGGVLSVIAGAALVTGVGLLVYAALEE